MPKKTICIFTKDLENVYAIKSFFEDADVSVRDLFLYADLRFYATDTFGDGEVGDSRLQDFVELMRSRKQIMTTEIL